MKEGNAFLGLEDFKLLLEADASPADGDIHDLPDEVALEKLVPALARIVTKSRIIKNKDTTYRNVSSAKAVKSRFDGLPTQIVCLCFFQCRWMLTDST